MLVGSLNILNDISDLKIDRLIHMKRALASGRISLPLTIRYLLVLISGTVITAIIAAFFSGILPFIFFLVGLGLAGFYEVYLKRKGLLGNAIVALLFAFPFLLGGSVGGINTLVVILCAMAAIMGMSKEIINGVKDLEGDRGNRKTLPQTIGVKPALSMASILLVISILLSFLPIFVIGPAIIYMVFMGISDSIMVLVMFVSFRRPKAAHHLQSLGIAMALPAIISISIGLW
jgi:4-hydroxybenzoate polyprenyltransferase